MAYQIQLLSGLTSFIRSCKTALQIDKNFTFASVQPVLDLYCCQSCRGSNNRIIGIVKFISMFCVSRSSAFASLKTFVPTYSHRRRNGTDNQPLLPPCDVISATPPAIPIAPSTPLRDQLVPKCAVRWRHQLTT